jgi:CBS domain-containing protein
MNVAYFLTPKRDVAWVPIDASLRRAFDLMEASGYTAVPLLDGEGHYAGTVTEGDLLRHLMSCGDASAQHTERVRMADVALRAIITPVDIDADIEALFERAIKQNFVPVQDSRGAFIGIVRRRHILEYSTGLLRDPIARGPQ